MNDPWIRIRHEQLAHELQVQAGVVTWAQLIASGQDPNTIRRLVQRREYVRLHPRVYLNHTGTPSLEQRCWAAVLWAAPAALVDVAADESIQVAVAPERRLTPPAGVRVRRVTGWESMVRSRTSPPRLALEHALLLRAADAPSEDQAVALLAAGIGRRGVSVEHVRRALTSHPKLHRRRLIGEILGDLAEGTESVLERGYLRRVERAHALPRPTRQSPRSGERRDIEYVPWDLVIELDGRLGHETWDAGNRDAARDLSDVADGRTVLRLRWRQVMGDPCRTARGIALALQRRGWGGSPKACSPQCTMLGAQL